MNWNAVVWLNSYQCYKIEPSIVTVALCYEQQGQNEARAR